MCSDFDNGFKAAQQAYDHQLPPEELSEDCQHCDGTGANEEGDACHRCEGKGYRMFSEEQLKTIKAIKEEAENEEE